MLVTDLIETLMDLPEDTEILVQTSHYDGGSERYDPMQPTIVCTDTCAILCGNWDYWGKHHAVAWLSPVHPQEIKSILNGSANKFVLKIGK